jgi:hypothetical protein
MKLTTLSIESFHTDCRELRRLLLESESQRLRGLKWCGRRVLEICDSPGRYLAEKGSARLGSRMAHGQVQFQPADFQGAFCSRGSKWFLPGLDSSPFPKVQSELADLVLRARSHLESDFETVRVKLEPHPDHDEVIDSGEWKAFIAFGPGGLHPALKTLPPLWCVELLRSREFCRNFGFCMFLLMRGDSSLKTHVGSTNLRLRCHLGIAAPENGGAALTVGGSTFEWRKGEFVIFDDSYPHSARNRLGGDRTVFSIDIWHPGLTLVETEALSSDVFSRFGKLHQT